MAFTAVFDADVLHPAIVTTTLQRQANALDNPSLRLDELLDKLELNGLTRTAAEVRRYLQP